MKKSFRRRRFFDGAPEGVVYVDGAKLRLRYQYTPERVAALKRLSGARFDPATKSWTLPIDALSRLKEVTLFSQEKIIYKTPEDLILMSIEERKSVVDAAWKAISENPFSVSASIRSYIPVEVEFTLSTKAPILLAHLLPLSPAEKIFKKRSEFTFSRPDKAYIVPVQSVTELLKALRDAKVSFAVDSETSARLTESASTRAKILSDPLLATSKNLETALLTPYVKETEDGRYSLEFASAAHLKALFPELKTFHDRRRRAQSLGKLQLLDLVATARSVGTPLYLTASVYKQLERESEAPTGSPHFEALFENMDHPIAWGATDDGDGALLVRGTALDELEGPITESIPKARVAASVVGSSRYYVIPKPWVIECHAKLLELLKGSAYSLIPESHRFKQLMKKLLDERALLEETKRLNKQTDADLSDTELSAESKSMLFPHQRVAVRFLLGREAAFLGDDMGLGKTLSVLTTFEALRLAGKVDFLLVACPNSLTRNWIREGSHWFPKLKLHAAPKERSERIRLLKYLGTNSLPADGLIINYESARLEYVLPLLESIVDSRKVMLCLDESQRVKNSTSQTFSALAQLAPRATRKVLLSGTPIPKDLSDIWAQYYLLDGGERFGRNFYQWLGTIAELGTEFSDVAVRAYKPEGVEATINRVHELLLRRRKEEVINLPPRILSVRDVELGKDQLKRYDEICSELLLRLTSTSGDTFVREIQSLLEEYLRAVQIASNPRLVDPSWKGEPAKFLELDQIIDEVVVNGGGKIVVWTNYLGNVAELTQRYSSLGSAPFSGEVSTANRDATIQEFQNGTKIKVLVAVPAAGGVGITLTAAQTAVYVERTWNAEHWLQSMDRIHRIGQKGTAHIISLSACKVDELIGRNLARKARMQAELLGDNLRGAKILDEQPSRAELIEALNGKTTAFDSNKGNADNANVLA